MSIAFPLAIIDDVGARRVFDEPSWFVHGTGAEAVSHPPADLTGLSDAEWAEKCPLLRRVPIIDAPPDTLADHRLERRPVEQWAVDGGALRVVYAQVPLTAEEIAARDAAAVPLVPDRVTNFQARAALLAAGLFSTVNSALMALPEDSAERQAWEYANEITRAGTLVNAMAAQLGLTATQLDNLFRAAGGIEA